jgi:hypothetical protein
LGLGEMLLGVWHASAYRVALATGKPSSKALKDAS